MRPWYLCVCARCSQWFEEEQVPLLFWSQAFNLTAEMELGWSVRIRAENPYKLVQSQMVRFQSSFPLHEPPRGRSVACIISLAIFIGFVFVPVVI